MTTVTFNGIVSAQATAGETVTLHVTLPDNTIETLATITLIDLSFNTTKDYLPGVYSVYVSIDADNHYKAASSAHAPVSFTVGLMDRTITVNVSVA